MLAPLLCKTTEPTFNQEECYLYLYDEQDECGL